MPSSIINSDDGVISGTSGIKTTGGDDGVLNIQSNGSTVVAVDGSGVSVTGTLSSSGGYGAVSATTLTVNSNNISADNSLGFRNRIINGDMRIDQRNAGASVTLTAGGIYTVDRWQGVEDTDGGMTAQQDSSAPAGFVNSVKCTTTTADGTLTTTQNVQFRQAIEGLNVADLAWGTANAKTVTLSFWVRSSLTGTFGGSLRNSAVNRSYPFTYSISVADTWEQKSITIAGDTTGTWLTTNGIGVTLTFGLGAGPDRSGTAGAWNSNNNTSATGAVSVIGTLNATWYITGVQLEVGSVATPFERRPYGTELALCQRYYIKYSGNGTRFYGGRTESTSVAIWQCALPVEMRAVPTVSAIDVTNLAINDTSVQVACTSISTAYSSTRQIAQAFNCGTVTSTRYIFLSPTSATAAVEASAEL
jgi:hypothetical protein